MNTKYSTPNQGLAAYIAVKGHELLEATKKESLYGGESYFFVFELGVDEGIALAREWRDKQGQVDAFQYYEEIKNVRALLRETRKKESAQ